MGTPRVLVSGASGFIGRWSVPSLIAAGYEVHAVAHSAGRRIPDQLRGALIHDADLLSHGAIDRLVGEVKPSHMLHFAWIATPGLYWNSPDNARWLAASQHLLRCFRDNGGVRAVMAGTCAEYDWSRVGVCEERRSPLADGAADGAGAKITPYASSKLAMYRSLTEFGDAHGFSTAWGRVFFQYGPHEHPDRLVAFVISRLLAALPAPCTHGRQIRSFLHAADVGAAFAALLDSSVAGPVNIGSDAAIRIAELLDEVARQIGRPELLQLGAREAPASEPPLLLPKIERLRSEVTWQPRFDLGSGIAATISWWREHLDQGSAMRFTC